MFQRLFSSFRSEGKKETGNRYDIDPDCNYCPNCGDAYREEIKTCAECDVPLIPGPEALANLERREIDRTGDGGEITTDDELVTIQVGKLKYLKEQQHLLKMSHVPSLLAGDGPVKG